MGGQRADLGFGDALEGFDPAEWTPDPVSKPRTDAGLTRKAAAVTGFQSRESGQGGAAGQGAPEETPPVRRRRTGRNAQLNLKARPDTIAAFCAIADRNGWGLGETLEHAVSLLQKAQKP